MHVRSSQEVVADITSTVDDCVQAEFKKIQKVPLDSSAASVRHRSRDIASLQNLVKKRGHGLRNDLSIRNLGSTLIPDLVLGPGFQSTMAKGLLKGARRVQVVLKRFSESLQQMYDQVGNSVQQGFREV